MSIVYFLQLLVLLCTVYQCSSIKCYQCSSDQDPKGEDICGAYNYFSKERNGLVDCLGEEANTPGTFCYKSIQQSPRGFIWDGRWRTVIRRCAQMSERGINWGCDWGYRDNGVYWEECYCAEDGCNGTSTMAISRALTLALLTFLLFWYCL